MIKSINLLRNMESLDLFRYSWQEELTKDKSHPTKSVTDTPQTPIGELCRIGANSKPVLECQTPIPLPSQSVRPSTSTANNASFTIGIRTFSTSNSAANKPSSIEPPSKKLKTSNLTLLDEFIRDIDESTDVPFFNVSLPREIALQIFDYLSIQDLYSCLRVCKSWYSLSCDELLWYNLYKRLKLENPNRNAEDSWKNQVKEAILSNQQVIQNFKTHQCRITKLTNRLGVVLTCANNNQTTIVAGYSAGIIRTWSIDAILNADEDNEPLDTADTIYESIENDLASVKSVGCLKDDIYAIHDDGLVEVWKKDVGEKPRFTQQLLSLPIEHVANDEQFLCTASRYKFHVWNFNEVNMKLHPLIVVYVL